MNVSHVTLQSTVIWGNNGTGILIKDSSNVGIASNNVTKNGCCAGVQCCLLYSPGIELDHSSSIDISKNSVTSNYGDGVFLNVTHNVRIVDNTISRNNPPGQFGCVWNPSSCSGILVYAGNNTTITGNVIESNLANGLAVYPSFNLTITGNSFTSNAITLNLDSDQEFESLTISADNKIDGKPIYYYKDCKGLSLDGLPLGQLIVFNCDGVRLANLALVNTAGVFLWRVHGVLIIHDTFVSSRAALRLQGCNVISVIGNNFTNSPGLLLSNAGNITIASNVFNGGGISNQEPQFTYDGLVYHNNFLNIPSCCSLSNAIGWRWDNGYPSGGNYYSDYSGTDNCSGPSQNICPNPDGIWDRPGPNSMLDHYPLVRPFSPASDTAAPTWRSNSTLTASNIGSDSVTLRWSAAQDDVEVIAYRIDLGTTTIAYVPGRYHSYQIAGLSSGTTYTFKIVAGDASNNWSANGLSTSVTTSGQTASLLELVAIIAGLGVLGSALGFLGWKRYWRKHINQGQGRGRSQPPSSVVSVRELYC